MNNFNLHIPTQLYFGKDQHKELSRLIPYNSKILLLYGGGSIKHNGIYEQVIGELSSFDVMEFRGIEANPQYTTLTKALEVIKLNEINFLLAVGGGSVIDGTKFLARGALRR